MKIRVRVKQNFLPLLRKSYVYNGRRDTYSIAHDLTLVHLRWYGDPEPRNKHRVNDRIEEGQDFECRPSLEKEETKTLEFPSGRNLTRSGALREI